MTTKRIASRRDVETDGRETGMLHPMAGLVITVQNDLELGIDKS